MNTAQDRRPTARTIALGVATTAAAAGLVAAGAGAASAAPSAPEGTYTKTFTSRYYPTPQSAVIGAEINLYLFNSVRLNGNQACSEQRNPLVKPDKPTGWTATITAICLRDAGTANSNQSVN